MMTHVALVLPSRASEIDSSEDEPPDTLASKTEALRALPLPVPTGPENVTKNADPSLLPVVVTLSRVTEDTVRSSRTTPSIL